MLCYTLTQYFAPMLIHPTPLFSLPQVPALTSVIVNTSSRPTF